MSNNNSLTGRVATGSGQNDLRGYISPDAGDITFEQLDAELQEAIRLAETALQPSDGVVVDANYVHTDNNFTTNYKNILDNFDPGGGGFTQVQVDWNEADADSIKFIKNKPAIPSAQVQSDWNEDNTTSKAYILHKPDISNLALKNGSPEEYFQASEIRLPVADSEPIVLSGGDEGLFINDNIVVTEDDLSNYLTGFDIEDEDGQTISIGSDSDTLTIKGGNKISVAKTNDNELTISDGYESEAAAEGGSAVSLVTTGEKYTWNSKQDALVSGTNIKTINNQSIVGGGNITITATARMFSECVVVAEESVAVTPSDLASGTPLYIFDCSGDGGTDAEITLSGAFADGDTFCFAIKAGSENAYINSSSSNLHETGNATGVSQLEISLLCVEYVMHQIVYTPLGWIMD